VKGEDHGSTQELERGANHRHPKQVESMRTVVEVCREHGVGESTFYQRRTTYGGLEVKEARRLKSLEDEKARLKRLYRRPDSG
jgi:putative transposase